MKTVEKIFPNSIPYDLNRLGTPEKLLFFDIETTGLSPYNSALYLIGCLYVSGSCIVFKQWFSTGLSDETDMLNAFFSLASEFDTLVHYNGDTFDLRYLQALADQYHIETPFARMGSVDLLKRIRKVRPLLQLENCRLKTVERFLGIDREDRFSGGELIDVYLTWLKDRDPRLLELLLLHNEEDILNLPNILPVLTYADLLDGSAFTVREADLNEEGTCLNVRLETEQPFPVPVRCVYPSGASAVLHQNTVDVQIPVYQGELKLFYPNSKDYCYLPEEDTAIHRRLAQFVDKAHRVQATPSTAYTRVSGTFCPAVKGLTLPVFYPEYKSGDPWVLLQEDHLMDYLSALIGSV